MEKKMMMPLDQMNALDALKKNFSGELFYDELMRCLYATDASAYQEMPLAVAIPRDDKDLQLLLGFANIHGVGLIPRTAGTSLAGQVVGDGIVVDTSKYYTQILELNVPERWVRVQPGVVRNELNQFLKPHGLMFGPETSTASRAMVGGMIGNNSCGSNSLVYGNTRDKLIEVKGFLADGTPVHFQPLSQEAFLEKAKSTETPEGRLYHFIQEHLSDEAVQQRIHSEFPRPSIHRRNTGYALDSFLEMEPFGGQEPFNFCQLIAGSEGTLLLITEAKLSCDPLPAPDGVLLCAHFNTLEEALRANCLAAASEPAASELIDHYILECTEKSISYRKLRFFVEGNPAAILAVEFRRETAEASRVAAESLIKEFNAEGLGYAFPLLKDEQISQVWSLRSAGLGLLSNIPGDAKPVALVEDAAVAVADLPAYVAQFDAILKAHGLYAVHYGHAGSGELHLRPILNLKTPEGNALFRQVAREVAELVKSFRGALSGEHGDGRLRGEFLPLMVGEENYQLFKDLKQNWDPRGLMNPGKIVEVPPMNQSLRYEPGQSSHEFETYFDFSENKGMLRLTEMCNGSGDCRKSHLIGGLMCPSFMATRNEKESTRARANTLRHALSGNPAEAFTQGSAMEVLDLCLSCKGCKSECPSNVDMARLKAEYTAQYYDRKGVPAKVWMFGRYVLLLKLASRCPWIWNAFVGKRFVAGLLKSILDIAPERQLPEVAERREQKVLRKAIAAQSTELSRAVRLLIDEFIWYQEPRIALAAIELLNALGIYAHVLGPYDSGRVLFSKGLLKSARRVARANVGKLTTWATDDLPIVGIEPSAILGFRDEYPDIVGSDLKEKALGLKSRVQLVDEFLAADQAAGNWDESLFVNRPQDILFHGHCHQKALSEPRASVNLMSVPKGFQVEEIKSGCCGMAGSFGYAKENYELSQRIGELVLFPRLRRRSTHTWVAASGTSCRQQIKDALGIEALHPVEVLRHALKSSNHR